MRNGAWLQPIEAIARGAAAPSVDPVASSRAAMLERLGVNIRDANANTKNLAAVMVTATILLLILALPMDQSGGRR